MSKNATIILLLFALNSASAIAAEPKLLVPGSFLGDGPWSDVSGEWLAFVPDPPRMLRTQLKSRPGEKTCTTSTRIEALDAQGALFLVQNLPQLRPGAPVATGYRGQQFLFPGQHITVRLQQRSWILRAFGTANPNHPDGLVYTNYEVHLLNNRMDSLGAVFRLASVAAQGSPHVVWAGDADHDGLVDVFAELAPDYVGHVWSLFLSTGAPGGNAPALVASLRAPSC
jgi:hypothetical protein